MGVPTFITSALYPPPDIPLKDYCALGDVTTDSVTVGPVLMAVPIIATVTTTDSVTTDVPVTTTDSVTIADVTNKVLPAIVPGGGSDSTKSGPSDDAAGSDTFGKVLTVTPATHNTLSEHARFSPLA